MHGTTVARDAENWHLAHGGQAGDPEWEGFVADFRAQLDTKYDEMLAEHDNGGRFGMSKAGGCTRASALKFLGAKGEPFTGSTRVTFFIGHLCEVIAITTLRRLGYVVDGTQEPVKIDPFMHSYSDGIITGVPVGSPIPEQTVLSVKSAGYKKSGKERRGSNYIFVRRGFPELPFEGVRKSQPSWYAQVQAEMHGYKLAGRDIRQALVFVVSKDIIKAMEADEYLGPKGNGSLTFYTEIIKYDATFCEKVLMPAWQRTWDAAQAGNAGPAQFLSSTKNEYVRLQAASTDWNPNAGLTGTFNPCNYCDLLSDCKAQLGGDWLKNRQQAAQLARV